MTKYLFVCSIGPVQDFIAAARSSRDLTYGSWLLSELAKTAARAIAEREGFDALIFPAPQNKDDLAANSDLSVANKVLAVVKGDPKALADDIEKVLRGYILDAWQPVEKELGKDVDADLARRQLHDLLEFYWAATSLDEDKKNGYKEARGRCEAALSARKTTRDFKPYAGASRFKSSIDGWREHVLSRAPDRYRPPKPNMQRYKLRSGELLSGVDLLKRWGKSSKVERYPSVSHLAALPFAEGLGREKANELKRRLVQLFREQDADPVPDYSVFFPSEVRAAVEDKQVAERLLQEQERLLTEYAGRRRPAPYYALLRADGDFMGKTIDERETREAHRELSQALSKFVKAVPEIVQQEHQGVAIYSGGDDILAYLPLHTALDCVKKLADRFAQDMAAFSVQNDDGSETSPTLSAGLVIAHHLEPLSDVLALARRTEKAAKGVPGKNALAIALNKRSGAERTVKDNLPALIKRLQTMTAWWLDGTLSKGTAYELERLAREMEGVLPNEALRAEAIRILKRKRESGGGQEVQKDVIEKMEKWLEEELKEQNLPLSELAQEMIIADEFARAEKQKRGKEAA